MSEAVIKVNDDNIAFMVLVGKFQEVNIVLDSSVEKLYLVHFRNL